MIVYTATVSVFCLVCMKCECLHVMHFIKTRRMVGEIDVFWQNMNHSTKDLIHSAILH